MLKKNTKKKLKENKELNYSEDAEQHIRKNPMICHIIISAYLGDDEFKTIYDYKIFDGCKDLCDVIYDDEEIIGVIPSPPRSYAVKGELPDGTEILLGYEYEGATHPDWKEELMKRIKERLPENSYL